MEFLLLSLFFIVAQAFFSGIETGLVSLRKSRVRHGVKSGTRGAAILEFFITHPGYMLATTLVGTNISVVCASKMAKEGVAALGFAGSAPMIALTAVMTLFLMAAEIIPKDWFRQSPYHRCLRFAPLLKAAYFILYVPVRLMEGLTKLVTRLVKGGIDQGNSEAALMREDFRMLLRESETAGIIDSEAADILDRSLEFHGIRVSDIFQPKRKVVDAPADMTVEEALRLCAEKGVSRLPVRGDSKDGDAWIGVFSLYDVIFSLPAAKWSESVIGEHSRPIRSVPLNATMETILVMAKESGSPLLAVISEDGSTEKQVGVVSGSDVVRRLFG
jgi:CBS domain containing-hemolysin-like protein